MNWQTKCRKKAGVKIIPICAIFIQNKAVSCEIVVENLKAPSDHIDEAIHVNPKIVECFSFPLIIRRSPMEKGKINATTHVIANAFICSLIYPVEIV